LEQVNTAAGDRIRPDGSQEVAAVFRDDHWDVVVERPVEVP
jgi:hypothetical protein